MTTRQYARLVGERTKATLIYRRTGNLRTVQWAERGEITLDAAAEIIGVCKMTALRMPSR